MALGVRDVMNIAERVMRPLRRRVDGMVMRVVISSVNDGLKKQGLKVVALADEDLDDVEHLQPGGLSHVATAGAEGVMLCVMGSREATVALGVANRAGRPTGLAAGETALYTVGDNGGTKILLKANGDVEFTPTDKVTVKGDLDVEGEVTAMSAVAPVGLSTHLTPSPFGPLGPPTPNT